MTGVTASTAAPADEVLFVNSSMTRLDRPTRPELSPTLNWSGIGPGYFQTLGTRLIAGRMPDLAHGGD